MPVSDVTDPEFDPSQLEADDPLAQDVDAWLVRLLARDPDEIDLGLTRVREVADRLNLLSPQGCVITVAGTNGKGSSVAMLSEVYLQAGYRVGTYTSPHFHRFNERIRIQGVPVASAFLIEAFEAVEVARQGCALTYFEAATLAAFWVFQRSELDIWVLEVGLGGRLDAVNVLDADACLVTAIGLDHQAYLGSDRATIGREKAGIFRPGVPCVCSDRQMPETVAATAKALKAPLWSLGQTFDWSTSVSDHETVPNHQAWWVDLPKLGQTYSLAPLQLVGDYQRNNAAGVVALVARLASQWPVSAETLRQALADTRYPGRMQTLCVNQQTWWLDVAHNPQAANALAQTLKQTLKQSHDASVDTSSAHPLQPISLACVFAVMADKDTDAMIEALQPMIHRWHLVPLPEAGARALTVSQLAQRLRRLGVSEKHIQRHDSMASAIDYLTTSGHASEPRLVWGSFYTVAAALKVLAQPAQARDNPALEAP